jgi:hypothetical protein
MSIRATSRLWRRPWAQTIGQRALRSPPRTLAQDPYALEDDMSAVAEVYRQRVNARPAQV